MRFKVLRVGKQNTLSKLKHRVKLWTKIEFTMTKDC